MTVIAFARKGTVYGTETSIEVMPCAECGILFGVPEGFAKNRRQDGHGFYCPNGHSLSYHETDLDRERKRAEQLERNLRSSRDTADRWRANAEREARSAAAYKGHLTRMRKRIANGVCPVPGCTRSGFEDVMRHLSSKHADWLHDHPELREQT